MSQYSRITTYLAKNYPDLDFAGLSYIKKYYGAHLKIIPFLSEYHTYFKDSYTSKNIFHINNCLIIFLYLVNGRQNILFTILLYIHILIRQNLNLQKHYPNSYLKISRVVGLFIGNF